MYLLSAMVGLIVTESQWRSKKKKKENKEGRILCLFIVDFKGGGTVLVLFWPCIGIANGCKTSV